MTRPASFARSLSDRPRLLPGLTRTLTVAGVAVGLATVAGCQAMSPSQTQVPYQPADGVALTAGPVQVRDLLIVASAAGATGVVSGSIINTGSTAVTISFAATADPNAPAAETAKPTPLELAPREQRRITGVEIPAVAVAPGALTRLDVTTTDGVAQTLVPVLLPADYYATLTPSPTPTATPSESTTAPGTETPTTPAETTTATQG